MTAQAHDATLDLRAGAARRQKRGLWRNPLLIVGALIILTAALVSVFAPVLSAWDYLAIDTLNRLQAPSSAHPFGTDRYGRDVLSRIMFGGRISLGIAFTSVLASATLGSIIGLLAGFYGGTLDNVLMRFMDLFFCVPALLLAVMLAASLGPGASNATLAITIIFVPLFARVARAGVLGEVFKEYVDAARVVGAKNFRLITRHVVPNILTPVIIQFSISLASAILLESGLSYLGLGVQPPYASWGTMLNEGRAYMGYAFWLSVFPGVAISLVVLGAYLLGDGLQILLNPRSR